MVRDTASRKLPTSLFLVASEKSTITSTKSTMISTTPNTLQKNKTTTQGSFYETHQGMETFRIRRLTESQRTWQMEILFYEDCCENESQFSFNVIRRSFKHICMLDSNLLIHCVRQHILLLSIINLYFCILHLCNGSDSPKIKIKIRDKKMHSIFFPLLYFKQGTKGKQKKCFSPINSWIWAWVKVDRHYQWGFILEFLKSN